jgi:short-subunit dehydrogenase
LELAHTNIKIITLNTGPVTSKFRDNAVAMFEKNVDVSHSNYKSAYEKELSKRLKSKDKAPFTLSSQDVARIVYTIVCAQNPKPRYYITKATYLLGFFKRILPTRLFDKVLVKI